MDRIEPRNPRFRSYGPRLESDSEEQFLTYFGAKNATLSQRYTYRVLQTIQMKLILLCVWAGTAVLGSIKTALKFKYEIQIGYCIYNSMYVADYMLKK